MEVNDNSTNNPHSASRILGAPWVSWAATVTRITSASTINVDTKVITAGRSIIVAQISH